MEDKNYLIEAFKAFDNLDDLKEDVFDITTQNGLDDAKEFNETPVDDSQEVVIDTEAETEEEVKEDYIGDVILQCETCKGLIYKKPEDVKIDEETSLANIEEECPVCQSTDGFKIIGEVAEFTEEALEEPKKPLDDKDADEEPKEIKEDLQKVEIETSNDKITMDSDKDGKVTVSSELKQSMIKPVSDEAKDKIENEQEVVDVDFDEFDEKGFDQLGENYLRNVYENVKSFKTTSVSTCGNTLKLEGLITFKSGKSAKTNFIFESYKATKRGKLKFIGENKQFAKGKKSFTLTGTLNGNKLICESLNYNYVARKANGARTRIYDTVKI